MSRTVIQDIVIPIVSRIMAEEGYSGSQMPVEIRDESLEEFLEEEMRKYFGVIGSNECQHLREQLEEAKKNDPYAFEYLLKQLLKKYVKLSVEMRKAKRRKNEFQGPPDRFLEQRRQYNNLVNRTD
jgi:hypothetical protein